MVYYKTEYQENAQNSEILASANQTFFSSENTRANLSKNGQSFNALEIVNNSNSVVIKVLLDGLTEKTRIVFAKSNLVINAEDNIFFNTIKIENTSAIDKIIAGDIVINARIVKEIKEVI